MNGGKKDTVLTSGPRFSLGHNWCKNWTISPASNRPELELPEPFAFETLDRSTHYFWEDGKSMVAWSDRQAFVQSAKEAFGSEADALESHIRHSGQSFEATRQIFLEQSLHEWRGSGKSAWQAVLPFVHRLPWLGTLHRWNKRRLKEPHLVQLFDRYATYNGSDPHRAPAMLHVIPHLEHGLGTHFPKGGMHGITRHLTALAEALGVEINAMLRWLASLTNRARS